MSKGNMILSEIKREIKDTERYLKKLYKAASAFKEDDVSVQLIKPHHKHKIDHNAAYAEILKVAQEQKKPWTVYQLFAKVNQDIVTNPQIIYRFTEKNKDIHLVGKAGRAVTYEYVGTPTPDPDVEAAATPKKKTTRRKTTKRKKAKLNPRGYALQIIQDVLRQNGSKTAFELLPLVNNRIRQHGQHEITRGNLDMTLQNARKRGLIETDGYGRGNPNNKGGKAHQFKVKETRVHLGSTDKPDTRHQAKFPYGM